MPDWRNSNSYSFDMSLFTMVQQKAVRGGESGEVGGGRGEAGGESLDSVDQFN